MPSIWKFRQMFYKGIWKKVESENLKFCTLFGFFKSTVLRAQRSFSIDSFFIGKLVSARFTWLWFLVFATYYRTRKIVWNSIVDVKQLFLPKVWTFGKILKPMPFFYFSMDFNNFWSFGMLAVSSFAFYLWFLDTIGR